jgi:hypothetical protein
LNIWKIEEYWEGVLRPSTAEQCYGPTQLGLAHPAIIRPFALHHASLRTRTPERHASMWRLTAAVSAECHAAVMLRACA